MRRQDIRLRLLARQGDPQARLKLGEAYLAGAEGIARSISVGLDYLRAASAQLPLQAATCIARQLQLADILKHGQMDMLVQAAAHDDEACLKLAALYVIRGDGARGLALLQRRAGLAPWLAQFAAESGTAADPAALLRAICTRLQLDVVDIVQHEVSGALARQDLAGALRILDALAVPVQPLSPELAQLVVDVLQHAENGGQSLGGMLIDLIEDSLEQCAGSGKNSEAARKKLREALITALPLFKAAKFFLNPEMSLADCALAPLIWRLPSLGVSLPREAAAVVDYGERIFRNPGFTRSLTPDEKLLRD